MSGIIENIQARLASLELKLGKPSSKAAAPQGYKNMKGLCAHFGQSQAEFAPKVRRAVALKKVRALIPEGGVRKVYSIEDVERELFTNAV